MPEDIDMIAALRRELAATRCTLAVLALMLGCAVEQEAMVLALDQLLDRARVVAGLRTALDGLGDRVGRLEALQAAAVDRAAGVFP